MYFITHLHIIPMCGVRDLLMCNLHYIFCCRFCDSLVKYYNIDSAISVYCRTLYGEGTETPPGEESCVVFRND